MQMNRKGFTLVELLAVLVILSVLSLVTVSGISASLEKRDIKECEEEIELAKNAAKMYFSLDGSGRDRVTVKELRDNNYLSEEKIKKIKDTDMITVSDYEYVYSGTDCNK